LPPTTTNTTPSTDQPPPESPAEAVEHAPRGRRVPAFAEQAVEPRALRRFVVGILVTATLVVLAVLGFNILVDPFGVFGTHVFPTAIESDRSAKITLLLNQNTSPDLLILGSSRSRPAQPSYLKTLTGHTGFNAGVTSGDAVDEWVFAHLLFARYPNTPHHVLLFINTGVGGNDVNPQMAADPRARPYLAPGLPGGEWSLLHKLSAYLSVDAAKDSYRVIRACMSKQGCNIKWFHPDGSLILSRLRSSGTRTNRMLDLLKQKVAYLQSHGINRNIPTEHDQLYFEKLLGYLNGHGVTPVIVMNPLQPQLFAELQRQHDPRRVWALNYLHQLHARYRFDFIDLTDIRTFGGSPLEFSDPTHVSTANMRLMLAYIVKHDNGIL
jgi:hypothetical protein